MVQQPRQEQPLYSCVVPIESVTGRLDEELMIFAASAEEVERQAKQMLADDYGCNNEMVQQLMQQARVEAVSPWCSTSDRESSELQ
ncbi:MAG TPA: hypothetical protein V6D50_15580 [Chroococcales cyanobacterium]|jgi:hypothetical protein